jgi:ankyrin repeat protein
MLRALTTSFSNRDRAGRTLLPAILLLAVSATASPIISLDDTIEEFFAAARKGDAAAVEAMLKKGVDVNAKWRYDQTALFPACDRGHIEVVKVLLAHGAKVDVHDSFYHATPMSWAFQHEHADIVKLLVQNGGSRDEALQGAVDGNLPELVKFVLDSGTVKPEILTRTLGAAIKNKHDDIAEMLKKAGAVPPSAPNFKVDEETLKSYAGSYQPKTQGPDLDFNFKDGKLMLSPSGQPTLTMAAFDKVKFTTVEFDVITMTFHVEDGKVTGLTLLQGGMTFEYKKVEAK